MKFVDAEHHRKRGEILKMNFLLTKAPFLPEFLQRMSSSFRSFYLR